jgi:hypothetical protein
LFLRSALITSHLLYFSVAIKAWDYLNGFWEIKMDLLCDNKSVKLAKYKATMKKILKARTPV